MSTPPPPPDSPVPSQLSSGSVQPVDPPWLPPVLHLGTGERFIPSSQQPGKENTDGLRLSTGPIIPYRSIAYDPPVTPTVKTELAGDVKEWEQRAKREAIMQDSGHKEADGNLTSTTPGATTPTSTESAMWMIEKTFSQDSPPGSPSLEAGTCTPSPLTLSTPPPPAEKDSTGIKVDSLTDNVNTNPHKAGISKMSRDDIGLWNMWFVGKRKDKNRLVRKDSEGKDICIVLYQSVVTDVSQQNGLIGHYGGYYPDDKQNKYKVMKFSTNDTRENQAKSSDGKRELMSIVEAAREAGAEFEHCGLKVPDESAVPKRFLSC